MCPFTLPLFSLYDLSVVTEEQIQQWADEAEAGYDAANLQRRGRGRPGRGAEPMQVVAVRVSPPRNSKLWTPPQNAVT